MFLQIKVIILLPATILQILSHFSYAVVASGSAARTPRLILEISRLSFGMYLMHMFFLSPIARLFIGGSVADPLVPVWLAIPCIAALLMPGKPGAYNLLRFSSAMILSIMAFTRVKVRPDSV